MITINKFYRTIIYFLIVCFLCVFPGSLAAISNQTVGTAGNTTQSLLFGLTICLLCFLLIWKSFRYIDTLSERTCFAVSLLVLIMITGLFTVVSFSARVTQSSDSIDTMDAALYLSSHSKISTDLPCIKYIGSFRNNYPQILVQSNLIKVLSRLGCHDFEVVLNHLNILLLVSTIVLTWLIVKDSRGIRAAAKTAVVCLFNPYLYLLVNWTYTLTYSLPIMMGILYVALQLKKTKTTHSRVALAILEGLLSGIGFLIRPTAVFPLIAGLIIWFPSVIKKQMKKEKAVQWLCALLSFVLIVVIVNIQANRKFDEIQSMNLPMSFWLMMGSHDNGKWCEADFEAIRAIPNHEDKAIFAWNQAINNYKLQGIGETISLWFRKMNILWANGELLFYSPAVSEGNVLSNYFLGSSARHQLVTLYCNVFRLLMIIGFLITCITNLIRKRTPEIILIMLITIFGGCVFHLFWETNTWYSAPFILPMLIVDSDGITTMQEHFDKMRILNKVPSRALSFVLMCFLLVVCICLNSTLRKETVLNTYRIYSTANTRFSEAIAPSDFACLNQDFYTKKSFNSLFIKSALPEQLSQEEYSEYELTLLNDEEQVVFQSLLLPDQLSGPGFKVSFDTVSGYEHYYIRIEKMEPEKKSILFYTHYTYGLDPYKGELTINNGPAYPSDLLVDVFYAQKTAFYGSKVRIILTALILSSGALIVFLPTKKKDK